MLSLRYNNISPHQRIYFKYLLPHLVSKAKLIIAVSETTKKDIIHFLKCPESKIKVIHNGYDHIRYFPLKEKTSLIFKEYGVTNYLLAVGPTYPHKNFERLFDAYNNLTEDIRRQYPLVIAGGKKKYKDHLKQYVKTLKLEKDVHFLGYVPVELMASIIPGSTDIGFPKFI